MSIVQIGSTVQIGSMFKAAVALVSMLPLIILSGCSGETGSDSNGAAALVQAEQLYKKNCKVCHAQGINGAPIVGNKKMWAPRLQKGVDVLTEHAIEGFGLMPAKGGKQHLTDAQIRSIVEYYVAMVE